MDPARQDDQARHCRQYCELETQVEVLKSENRELRERITGMQGLWRLAINHMGPTPARRQLEREYDKLFSPGK